MSKHTPECSETGQNLPTDEELLSFIAAFFDALENGELIAEGSDLNAFAAQLDRSTDTPIATLATIQQPIPDDLPP